MPKMILYLLMADGSYKKIVVKRFSNLSETKSRFYYYEELNDERGKGTCVPRFDVDCFELLPCIGSDYER